MRSARKTIRHILFLPHVRLAHQEDQSMTMAITTRATPGDTEAQYLVCTYLVRACQQAIYELALDDDREPAVRHNAIQTIRVILEDWRAARRELRRELTGRADRDGSFTFR
jgi:hypothetical protein